MGKRQKIGSEWWTWQDSTCLCWLWRWRKENGSHKCAGGSRNQKTQGTNSCLDPQKRKQLCWHHFSQVRSIWKFWTIIKLVFLKHQRNDQHLHQLLNLTSILSNLFFKFTNCDRIFSLCYYATCKKQHKSNPCLRNSKSVPFYNVTVLSSWANLN